jgi:hypothetical protein
MTQDAFEIAAAHIDYRCSCGSVYVLSINKKRAIPLQGSFEIINPNAEGWFECAGCEQRFRWEE